MQQHLCSRAVNLSTFIICDELALHTEPEVRRQHRTAHHTVPADDIAVDLHAVP